MYKYNPLLQRVWENELQNSPLCAQIRDSKGFFLEKAQIAWQEIERYQHTEGFYLHILSAYGQNLAAFLGIETGDGLEFSRMLAQFWRSLSENGSLSKQIERRKNNLLQSVIYYKYNLNQHKTGDDLLKNLLAYLHNPSYKIPIFNPQAQAKIDEQLLPADMGLISDSFEQKANELSQYLQLKAKNQLNNSLLLAQLLYADSVQQIWGGREQIFLESQEPILEYPTRKEKAAAALNQIFYGVAGVGKTYQARQTGLEISQNKPENIQLVSFHPAFFYEDFIEGIKPKLQKNQLIYELQDGIFKQFCKKAAQNPKENFVLIIDEINRANIPQVFGELISLIEPNKRQGQPEELSATLPYSREKLSVPSNLYLIGTMNSSDKSVSQLDLALRRRFLFKKIAPQYQLLEGQQLAGVDLRRLLETINQRLWEEIDEEHLIGQAYLMGVESWEAWLRLWQEQLLPLLEEFVLGDLEKIANILQPDFVETQHIASQDRSRSRWRAFGDDFPQPADFIRIYQ